MFLWLDLITLLIWFPLNDWQDLIKLAWTIKLYFFLVWSIWYYRLHLSTWFNHLYKSFWWVKLIWSVELNSINWIQIKLICCIGSVIRLDNLNLFRLNLFGPLAWINSIESTQSFQGDLWLKNALQKIVFLSYFAVQNWLNNLLKAEKKILLAFWVL